MESKNQTDNLSNNSSKSCITTASLKGLCGSTISNDAVRNEESFEEVAIEVPWGTVQGWYNLKLIENEDLRLNFRLGKWWGSRNKQPILALHGWQDNAGTFDRLCVLMPAEIPVLCIDLPGHGKSSYYPKGMQYFLFWDGICLIRRIIQLYSWKQVTLMGHSLGGALTFMYAAAFPTEVEKLINIDMAGPPVRNLDKQAESIGRALDKFLEYENLPESKMPNYSYDEMVKLVTDAYEGSVDEDSVKILLKRGMEPLPQSENDGFRFSRDLRLKVSMLGMFTAEQVLAYAKRIRCKVLNIRGEPGMNFENPHVYEQVVDILQQHAELVIYVKVPGTHHLHLVTPERIAPHINNFLLES